MCGREKDDKTIELAQLSLSFSTPTHCFGRICHLLAAVVEKDNVWERER